MGCAASTLVTFPRAHMSSPPITPLRGVSIGGGKQNIAPKGNSPVYRAVSLAWLEKFVHESAGTTQSWEVVKEFMAEEDGGGKDVTLTVTPDNLETHRGKRRDAEKARNGEAVKVEYRDIPFEQMYTTDVVECFVRPRARKEHASYAQADNLPVGAPTYFVSHAWSSGFVDLVKSVTGALAGATPADTYVWLDIFAINQDDTGGIFSAMHELDDGRTLAGTIATSRATLVVLDKDLVVPLTRLWCLYEIGATPPQKLQLVTHGFSENDVSQHIRDIDADTALCFSESDKKMIRGEITGKFRFESMRHFTEELKLRFMLRPMSYESDLQALRERGQNNKYELGELRDHVSLTGGRPSGLRQDVLEMARSLAFQLGQQFHEVRTSLLALDEETVTKALVEPDVAVSTLLVHPLKKLAESKKHAIILVDALDEADDQQRTSNVAVGVLRKLAMEARGAISVIATTRPDAADGYPRQRVLQCDWQAGMQVMEPARMMGPGAVSDVEVKRDGSLPEPWQCAMRKMQASMVYQIVAREFVKRYGASSEPPANINAAYHLWFHRASADDDEVRRLIDVVLASREPLSAAHVDRLGLRSACKRLPGWGLLFEERDHMLQTLHLSLREFLEDVERSGKHAANVSRGHDELARSCLDLLVCGDEEKGPAVAYALRHGHVHLTEVLLCGQESDKAMQNAKSWRNRLMVKRTEAVKIPEGYEASAWCASEFAGQWLKRHEEAGRMRILVVELLRLETALKESGLRELYEFVRVLRWGVGTYSLLNMIAENMPCTSAWHQSPGKKVLSSSPQILRIPARVDIDETILNNMQGHNSYVWSASFSRDGARIVSASADKTIRVWDATTGACLSVLEGHDDDVRSASFSRDGARIVSASADKTIRVWDATTGACVSVLKGHGDDVRSASFSPDGSCIASASKDKTVRVWDATTGACVSVLEGHDDDVNSASFSPDGTLIVSASFDKTIRVWEATTGACVNVLEGHGRVVCSALFSRDGTRIVSASGDKTIRVWDATTGACLSVLKGHHDWVTSATFGPDGTRIVSIEEESTTIHVWDATTGECVSVLEGHDDFVNSASYSADGLRIVSASLDKTVRVWEATMDARVSMLKGHRSRVISALYSPDGTRIVSASWDKTVRVWDATTGACVSVLEGHGDFVKSASYSADGTRIVSASDDNTVRVWDATTGACVSVLEGHDSNMWSASFSRDGARIVSASSDKAVRVWDATTGACVSVLEGHDDFVLSASFSPGGTRIVSASWDKTVRAWDATTGACISVMEGHSHHVTSASYSADGTRIVSASDDKTVRVWDATTGACVFVLEGHSASYSADGARIVSATSGDMIIRVWDATTGACVSVLEVLERREGFINSFTSVSFSADGTRIVSATNHGTIHVWDASIEP
ncbi:EF-hand domain-containing protein [Pycnococcus provasolii]